MGYFTLFPNLTSERLLSVHHSILLFEGGFENESVRLQTKTSIPSVKFLSLAKNFREADMGFLFENANAKSLDKKWCATSMLPIYTPLQVLPLKTIYKNRTYG